MTKLFKTVHNVETGEVTQEDLTADELAAMAADELEAQTKQAAQAKAATDKAALLAKLGISADEAKLLLS